MYTRPLGRTGLQISVLGYGTWGIAKAGWVGAEDETSVQALRRAMELGVIFVDTALAYGDGHGERLVGQAVRAQGRPVVVATKVPPRNGRWPAAPGIPVEQVFPGHHIMSCTEQSMRNLGLETIDVQQLHVWSDEWIGRGDWLEALSRLKEQGKIRYFGISTNDHQPDNALRLIATGVVDTVQVIYNVFDQSAADRLFPACMGRGVGIIARVPFDEGGLTGHVTPQTTFPRGDIRNRYFRGRRKREVYEHVQAIAADLGIALEEMPDVALRFAASHPAVSTVIAGMRSIGNVERNCASIEGGALSREQLEVLEHHRWPRNYYYSDRFAALTGRIARYLPRRT